MLQSRALLSSASVQLPDVGQGLPAPLLTRAELARWLNVSVRHTYKLEARGLQRANLDGPVRFDRTVVAVFLAARSREPAVAVPQPAGRSGQGWIAGAPAGRSAPARVGLAREIPSRSLSALAPALEAQALARVTRRTRS